MRKEVLLKDARPGMELAQAVHGERGDFLVSAGTFLTDAIITALHGKDIPTLVVMDPECEAVEDCQQVAREFVDGLFGRVDHDLRSCPDQGCHEVMSAIRTEAVERHTARLDRGYMPPEPTATNLELHNLGKLYVRGELSPLELVRDIVELVAFPDIYFRIRAILDDATSGARELAGVVGSDPSLTAKLLRLANSSFYGFQSSVDSLERAITLIGVRELSTLALGISTISVFSDVPPELTNMRYFWRHSVTCAILARGIAERTGHALTERFFVAGLLHDLGRLIVYKELPYATVEILHYAQQNAMPILEAEEVVLGFNHSMLGSLLLREWALPRHVCTIIRHHHGPDSSPEPAEAALIQLADLMAHALYAGEEENLPLASVSMDTIADLGLRAEDVPSLAQASDKQLDDLLAALF